jgi:hypothetical protein
MLPFHVSGSKKHLGQSELLSCEEEFSYPMPDKTLVHNLFVLPTPFEEKCGFLIAN